MKFRHLVSSTTPESLQNWLEEELESRGIDGVYTRYILSLLQHEPLTDIECSHFDTVNKYGLFSKSFSVPLSKSRHRRWKCWDHERPCHLKNSIKGKGDEICHCQNSTGDNCSDMERCKKSVAVECLKSASEEKNGIEKLIDEVCTKLKNLKADCESPKCLSLPTDSGIFLRSLTLSEPFPPGKHKESSRYYSAFPALSGKCSQRLTCPQLHQDNIGLGGAWGQRESDASDPESSESEITAAEISVECGGHQWTELPVVELSEKAIDSVPTFIVPKMSSHHKVPSNVAMFAPFTSPACQLNISKVVALPDNVEIKYNCSGQFDEKNDEDGLLGTEDDDWYRCAVYDSSSGIISPELGCKGAYLESDLASKFNSALAAIWGSEDAGGDNNFKGDSGVELSFQIYSMPTGIIMGEDQIFTKPLEQQPQQQPPPKQPTPEIIEPELQLGNINYLFGTSENVWSTNLDEMRALAGQDNFPSLNETSLICPEVTQFLQSLSLQNQGDEKNFSAYSDDLDHLSGSECLASIEDDLLSLGFAEPLFKDLLKDDYFESSSEKEDGALCLSPEMFFRETENDCMLSSTEGTEVDLSFQNVELSSYLKPEPPGVYNLWNSPSPRLALLGPQSDSGWPSSDPTEKVAQWISQQFEGGAVAGHQLSWDNEKASGLYNKEEFSQEEEEDEQVLNPSKGNCSITYHKGESCFVEVKPKGTRSIHSPFISPYSGVNYQSISNNPLAASSVASDDEEENLLTSHKTHFTPIRQESSETESSICDYDAVAVTLENSTTTFLKKKVKCSWEDYDEEIKTPPSASLLEEMLLLSAPLSLEDLERSKSPDANSEDILKTIQSGWKASLNRDKSTSTELVELGFRMSRERLETIVEPAMAFDPVEDPMGFASLRKMRIWSTDSMENSDLASDVPLPPHQIPWKWSTTDDTDEPEDHNPELGWKLDTPTTEPSSQDDCFDYARSLLSQPVSPQCTIVQEYNLDELRRELEAEEEQLFRDINLASDTEDYQCDGCLGASMGPTLTNTPSPKLTFCKHDLFAFSCESRKWRNDDGESLIAPKSEEQQNFSDEQNLEEEDEETPPQPAIPTEKILYSSQLEEEWRKSSQPFNIQVPRKSKPPKPRSSPQRRPCSFYLEGNCRRSDCKFSHDLSSITCRFWEEGSCFKGITCPFLHGYLSEEALRQKFGGKCKFALESEADFPSLLNSSSQNTPLSSSKDVMGVIGGGGGSKEVFTGRILCPKKKKLSSLVNKSTAQQPSQLSDSGPQALFQPDPLSSSNDPP